MKRETIPAVPARWQPCADGVWRTRSGHVYQPFCLYALLLPVSSRALTRQQETAAGEASWRNHLAGPHGARRLATPLAHTDRALFAGMTRRCATWKIISGYLNIVVGSIRSAWVALELILPYVQLWKKWDGISERHISTVEATGGQT